MPNLAKVVDGLGEIFGAVEAGAIQGLASENAEPDFDLVEPRSRCRGEVKRHVDWLSATRRFSYASHNCRE